MKKIIAFIFLLVVVNASAQNIPADDTASKPAITAIGKPDGEKTEMKIGKDGGSFTSSDGKMRLIIPEEAVSKKTTFSIQPVTNLMPNGNGKAYHLEPSGIQFHKPVQLVFHYDPEETEDSLPLLTAIAMQDDKGQWFGLNEFTLDTIAKTISGDITHFSVWATYDKLKLIAPKRMKVIRNGMLQINGVDSRTAKDKERMKESMEKNGEDYEAWEKRYQEKYGKDVLSPLNSWKPPQKGIWRVNKIIKGNAEFGTLDKGIVDESHAQYNNYIAPRNVPGWNPVTVSVDLVGAFLTVYGQKIKVPPLKAKILIYDNAYEVKMTSEIDLPSGRGTVTYLDTGSFVVSLNGNETKIIEKINKNTDDEFHYELPGCKTKTLKPGSGYIHMIGIPGITVTPATSAQLTRVRIQFKQTPLRLPVLEFTCTEPDGTVTIVNTKQANAMLAMIPAFPWSIEFFAKEGEWEIFETSFNIKEGETTGKQKALIKYMIKRLEVDDE
jgi:hypothetical protein